MCIPITLEAVQKMSCSRCGTTTLVKTVVKEGPNKGKHFFACPNKDCEQFFCSWIPDHGNPSTAAADSSSTKTAIGLTGSNLRSVMIKLRINKGQSTADVSSRRVLIAKKASFKKAKMTIADMEDRMLVRHLFYISNFTNNK